MRRTLSILLVLMVLVLPGCPSLSLFGGSRGKADSVPVQPRKDPEQVEIERRLADYSHRLADGIYRNGCAATTEPAGSLAKSTGALSSILGSPLYPLPDSAPTNVLDQTIGNGLELEHSRRDAEAEWVKKIDELKAQNSALAGENTKLSGLLTVAGEAVKNKDTILGQLGTGITRVVAILVIGLTVVAAARSWLGSQSLTGVVISGVIGGVVLWLWLSHASEILVWGLVAVGLFVVYHVVIAIQSGQLRAWWQQLIGNVQSVRALFSTSGSLAAADAQLQTSMPPAAQADIQAVKAAQGLPSVSDALNPTPAAAPAAGAPGVLDWIGRNWKLVLGGAGAAFIVYEYILGAMGKGETKSGWGNVLLCLVLAGMFYVVGYKVGYVKFLKPWLEKRGRISVAGPAPVAAPPAAAGPPVKVAVPAGPAKATSTVTQEAVVG